MSVISTVPIFEVYISITFYSLSAIVHCVSLVAYLLLFVTEHGVVTCQRACECETNILCINTSATD